MRCWVPSESAAPGQRDVSGLGGHLLRQQLLAQLELALLERSLHVRAHGVGELAHSRALLRGELAHHAHDGRELALLAGHADAQLLELLHAGDLGHSLGYLRLNGLEVVGHCHNVLPSQQKTVPEPMPKDGSLRGTTLIAVRVVSRERPLVGPVPWGGRLAY